MAKRSRRGLSKKMIPSSAFRTGKFGERVWKFNGVEYNTMRDLIFRKPKSSSAEDVSVTPPKIISE